MGLADFGERLTEERVRLGYTQAAFARLLGISRVGLRNIEAGQSDFKVQFLATAVASGVDAQYVLTGIRSKNLDTVEKEVGFERQAIQGSVSGVGFAQNISNLQIIHTNSHRNITKAETKPGTEHIDEKQKATLKDLVTQIAEKEATLKKNPKSFQAIWAGLNKHCGVTTYSLIAKDNFDKARKYLNVWLGRLNSAKSAPVKDGDAWRRKRISYIKVNTKDPDDEAAMRAYITRNFKAESLRELSNDEIEKTYRYVAGRNNRKR